MIAVSCFQNTTKFFKQKVNTLSLSSIWQKFALTISRNSIRICLNSSFVKTRFRKFYEMRNRNVFKYEVEYTEESQLAFRRGSDINSGLLQVTNRLT